MAGTYKIRNAHAGYSYRPRERRLLIARRKQEASQERDGDQLPAICRSCGAVLDLITTDALVFCSGCSTWGAADDVVVELEDDA